MNMDTMRVGDKVVLRDGTMHVIDSLSFGWVNTDPERNSGHFDKRENLVVLEGDVIMPTSEIIKVIPVRDVS